MFDAPIQDTMKIIRAKFIRKFLGTGKITNAHKCVVYCCVTENRVDVVRALQEIRYGWITDILIGFVHLNKRLGVAVRVFAHKVPQAQSSV